MSDNEKSFAARIVEARKARGLTQAQLARLSGSSQATLFKREHGVIKSSRFDSAYWSNAGLPLEEFNEVMRSNGDSDVDASADFILTHEGKEGFAIAQTKSKGRAAPDKYAASPQPTGKLELTVKVQMVEPDDTLLEVRDFLVGERQAGAGREIAIKFQRLDGRTFMVVMPDAIAESLVARLGARVRRVRRGGQ